jgi:hypothetical protein
MGHSRNWVAGTILTLSAALLAACASADPEGNAESGTEQAGGELVVPIPIPKPGLIQCGGIAGLRCPTGFECVDDPRDTCSPCNGGADCGGICVQLACAPRCDPTLICTQVITCVGGLLYPTGCGPRNCDKPIGPCSLTK